jgi:secreted PhoX family phosphatase
MEESSQDFSYAWEDCDASENIAVNATDNTTLGDLILERFPRRKILRGALGATAIATLATGLTAVSAVLCAASRAAVEAARPNFRFKEIAHGVDEKHHVAAGYDADVLIRWGDPVEPDAQPFDPYTQSVATVKGQYGYNNDFIGFVPLPFGSQNSNHGLLCVNHEYTDEEMMFPGFGKYDRAREKATKAITELEMANHGGSILEIERGADGKWAVLGNSKYARRINALDTEMRISGPAAGHKRMRTSEDPSGTKVVGTVNNCAGGVTPWGTYLMAEEKFNGYFWGNLRENPKEGLLDSNQLEAPFEGAFTDHPEMSNYQRYGVPANRYPWGRFHKRWNIHAEPNEPNRFGWIVEVDPLNPKSTPVKRTALGRFKHEGAAPIVNKDGRVVVYSGDDQRFEYLYKFVSTDRFHTTDREANFNVLDKGTLFVAKFHAEGRVTWLALVWNTGPLTPKNQFHSQADVLIETRRAADLLGATKMDRPEDVEPNPKTNKVYVMLTNNSKRGNGELDKVHDRAGNIWGQIVELSPPDGDHAALEARWDILVKCGNPKARGVGAMWNPATTVNGWFACPDNCTIDPDGCLWIATDQGGKWWKTSGSADGVWGLETEGVLRGTGKMFFRGPVGGEICGPCFTPDGETLFVAVQHPAIDGAKKYKPFGRHSTFADPATRWPDFDPRIPPRPSIVVITKKGGGKIGR